MSVEIKKLVLKTDTENSMYGAVVNQGYEGSIASTKNSFPQTVDHQRSIEIPKETTEKNCSCIANNGRCPCDEKAVDVRLETWSRSKTMVMIALLALIAGWVVLMVALGYKYTL